MRHRYTRQELESINRETPLYIEGVGLYQLQWGGWEIAEGSETSTCIASISSPLQWSCTTNTGRPGMGRRRRTDNGTSNIERLRKV